MAKYLDNDGLVYLWSKIKTLFAGKVDKETGKGLSTNDYTTAEKNKLTGIASGAEANVQSNWNESSSSSDAYIQNKPTKLSQFTNDGDGTTGSSFATQSYVDTNGGKIDVIKVNGTSQGITNKTVDISVPTSTSDLTNDSNFAVDANYVHTDNNYTTAEKNKLSGIAAGAEVNVQSDWTVTSSSSDAYIKNKPTKVSDFTNDSGFQNASQVQTAINSALEGITGIDFQVVQTLPSTGEKGVIYLLSNGGTSPNIYDEYIWVTSGSSGSFEKIGTTAVDLSGYWSKAELISITNAEIDTIVAA